MFQKEKQKKADGSSDFSSHFAMSKGQSRNNDWGDQLKQQLERFGEEEEQNVSIVYEDKTLQWDPKEAKKQKHQNNSIKEFEMRPETIQENLKGE